MFADHPADGIDDITLSTAIRTDDTGDAFIEVDDGFIGKTLESLDFQTL